MVTLAASILTTQIIIQRLTFWMTLFSGSFVSSAGDTSFSAAFEDNLQSSTPKKKQERNNNDFKAPKPPKQVFAKCTRCGAALKTMQTFQTHNLTHKWKDLASKIPSDEEIRTCCNTSIFDVLKKIAETNYAGASGAAMKDYAKAVAGKTNLKEYNDLVIGLSDIVVEGIRGVNIQKRPLTFIHTARKYLIEHINLSLNKCDVRDDLLERLLRVELCVEEIAYPFLTTLLRHLGNNAMKHMFLSMSGRDPHGQDQGMKRSKDDLNSIKSQQVLHYIAGFCMRSLIRHAYKYPNNEKLQRRKLCVLRRFGTIGQSVPSDPTDKSYWTSLLNRKALFFVREEVLPVFTQLSELLQKMEKPNGSVEHEAVMEVVSHDSLLLAQWSHIIDSDLEDNESFDLLVIVVRSLTNTFGRGVLIRRMNQRWKKGMGNKGAISISHRAKVL